MLSRISFVSSWSATLLVACLTMVFALAGSFSLADEWADATGKYRITAEYVRVENKNVILRKPDGRKLSVAIASLDEASRALAKRHYSKAKEKEKAAPLPAKNSKFKAEPNDIDLPVSSESGALKRFDRWKLRIHAKTIDELGQILDHYEISLAVIGGRPGMDYLLNLTSARPSSRIGAPELEERLYWLQNPDDPMAAWEQSLAKSAGIPTKGRQMLRLISSRLEKHLANVEHRYCHTQESLQISQIQNLEFVIDKKEDQFEISVGTVTLRE